MWQKRNKLMVPATSKSEVFTIELENVVMIGGVKHTKLLVFIIYNNSVLYYHTNQKKIFIKHD